MDIAERAGARVGQTLRGKWRIDRLIGVGGMAAVYAATHRNGKRGALKILHPEMSLNNEVKNRFLREGYVANKVDHPGVVSVLDDDVNEDGTVFLVMELLEGEAVDQLIARQPGGRMNEGGAVPVIADVLDVLASAHDKEIVHRDLKPENIFVTNKGQVKILDFGIARMREAAQQSGTQTGSLMGTPNFMAPEQARGDWDRVDGRTDIWAAGATLFAMLTGRAVHLGDNSNKVLLAAMTVPAPPIQSINPHVSQHVAYVVDRALLFDRDQRWPNAATMRDALRATAGRPQSLPGHAMPMQEAPYANPYAGHPTPGQVGQQGAGHTVSMPSSPNVAPGVAAQTLDRAVSTTSPGAPPKAKSSKGIWLLGALATVAVGIAVVVAIKTTGPGAAQAKQPEKSADTTAQSATADATPSTSPTAEPSTTAPTTTSATPSAVEPSAAASSATQTPTVTTKHTATSKPKPPPTVTNRPKPPGTSIFDGGRR